MPSDQTPWVVKGVPERIRRLVKAYAAAHDLTMAAALEFLIDCAVEGNEVRRIRWHDARIYFKHAGLATPTDPEAAALLARAAAIREQHEKHRELDLSGLDIESLRFASLIDAIPRGALGPESDEPPARRRAAADAAEPTPDDMPLGE